MKYLKVWTDFADILAPLNDSEVGRLFLAMLNYARTGEEPESFTGNESFLWAVAKRDIDITAEKAETLRQNGSRGGRPRTKDNQEKPNETKDNQSEPNESRKEKKRNEMKRNEMTLSFLDDAEAAEIQSEHNRVLDAAEDAGFQNSNSVRAGLLKLYADYGLAKVLDGIGACVKHGATNLAYLEAVLKGRPKKGKGETYSQRDYSDVPGEMMDELAAEMEAFKRGVS